MVCRYIFSCYHLGGYFVLWRYAAQGADYFCLLNCGNFYPFFILGAFTSKYNLMDKVRTVNWLFSVCILFCAVLFGLDIPIHALDSLNRHIFLPFCMVYVIVTLFVARNGNTSCVERVLECLGKRTLDVYVIHYFFISHIHLDALDRWMEATDNVLLSLLLSFLLAIVVTVLSMAVGYVLHKGTLIEKICFGR